jgi:chromosome segregation ATPase
VTETKKSQQDTKVQSDREHHARALTAELVGQSKSVLELDSDVHLAHVLQERQCQVVAVEQDPATCAALRRHCTAVIRGNARDTHLPQFLRGRKFDAVLVGSLLEREADPASLLRKLTPHLAPRGHLILTVSNVGHASVRLALLKGELNYRDGGIISRGSLHLYTLREIERTLLESGLVLAGVERVKADVHQVVAAGGQVWDPARLPDAVRLIIAQDPESSVAQYVIKATRASEAVVAERLAALESASPDGQPKALVDAAVQKVIDEPLRRALEAREEAEARLKQLEHLGDEAGRLEATRALEVAGLQQRVVELEQRVLEGEQRAAELDEVLALQRQTVSRHEEEMADVRRQLARKEIEAKEAEQRSAEQLASLAEELELKNGVCTEQRAAIAELRERLEAEGHVAAEVEEARREIEAEAEGATAQLRETARRVEEREAQIAALERQLEATTEELERARRERETQVTDLENQLRTALGGLVEIRSEAETSTAQLRDAEARAQDAEARARETGERTSALESELRVAASDREELQAQAQSLTARLQEAEARSLDREVRAVELENQLRLATFDLGALRGQAESLTAQMQEAEARAKSREVRTVELEEQLRAATSDAEELHLEAESLKAQLREALAHTQEHEAQIATLEERLEAAGREIERSHETLDDARRGQEAERARHEQQLRAAAEDRERLGQAHEQQLAELERRMRETTSDLHGLRLEAENLTAQLRGALARTQERESQIAALEWQLGAATKELAGVREDLERTRREGERRATVLEEQLAAAAGELLSAQREANSVTARLQSTEQSLRERGVEVGELERRLETLSGELAESRRGNAERVVLLEEEVRTKANALESARQEAEITAAQLRRAERRVDDHEAQVAVLERQLDRAERAAQAARVGLELHAMRLDQELDHFRTRLAFKMLGRYDQAKQLLLPPGSRRRALYERVLTYTSLGTGESEPTLYQPSPRSGLVTLQSGAVIHPASPGIIIDPPRA